MASKNGNLNNFIATVKNEGLMRTSRYAVTITPPKDLTSLGTNIRKIMMFCSDVSLPAINLSTVPIRQYGEAREVPYEKMYDNISMTFYVDNNMEVKLFFDRWMDIIQNPYTRTFNYYNNYTTTMDIDVEDLKDRKRYNVQALECYPKSVGAIQMGYDNKEIMKLTVSMNYKYWKSVPYGAVSDKKESPWSRFLQAPTINGKQIIDTPSVPDSYVNNFSGFQNEVNRGESNTASTGVINI